MLMAVDTYCSREIDYSLTCFTVDGTYQSASETGTIEGKQETTELPVQSSGPSLPVVFIQLTDHALQVGVSRFRKYLKEKNKIFLKHVCTLIAWPKHFFR